jgi:hypothetical protein
LKASYLLQTSHLVQASYLPHEALSLFPNLTLKSLCMSEGGLVPQGPSASLRSASTMLHQGWDLVKLALLVDSTGYAQ